MQDIPNVKRTINDESVGTETFERLLPELQALTTEELIPINLDIPTVVTTTLGALPEMRALRPEIMALLPAFDMATFNKLEDYAFTLNRTHAQYITATQSPDDLDPLAEEAIELRETLLADARALARHGHVDGNRLAELKGINGFKNIATDLGALATILRESWPNIEGRTSLELSELDRAVKMAHRILRIVGVREQGPAVVAAATHMRTRAFTLLAHAYDEARRVISFVRWREADVDKIAPSFYAGRRRRVSEASEPVAMGPSSAPAVAPAATSAESATHLPAGARDPFPVVRVRVSSDVKGGALRE
jgi:hypothetical protein